MRHRELRPRQLRRICYNAAKPLVNDPRTPIPAEQQAIQNACHTPSAPCSRCHAMNKACRPPRPDGQQAEQGLNLQPCRARPLDLLCTVRVHDGDAEQLRTTACRVLLLPQPPLIPAGCGTRPQG